MKGSYIIIYATTDGVVSGNNHNKHWQAPSVIKYIIFSFKMPTRCRHHPESSSYNIGVVPKSFE